MGGLAVGSGALNVSFSDGQDPYRQRAKRMLASCAITALAVFLGGILGPHYAGAVLISAAWAFAAGMAVAVGTTAGDLAIISVVVLLVYSAQALTTVGAAYAGLLALGGGLLQTAWRYCGGRRGPTRPNVPRSPPCIASLRRWRL